MRQEHRHKATRSDKKKKKRIETSKKIVIINYIIFISVAIATFVALFKGFDISSIVTFDLGILGVITTWNGFYAWKAKSENVLRISKAYEMDEEVVKELLLNAAKEVIGSTGGNVY